MFELHVISHPLFFEGEVDVLIRLLQAYDVVFHLRKPNANEEDYASLVAQIPKALYHKVVLHQCHHLAQEYDFAACHYSTLKRRLANNASDCASKSTSCHSTTEVKQLDAAFQSCFLSPVFDSISKQGYQSMFDKGELCEFLDLERSIKIVALGGVDLSNIQEVQTMGFDGAAVLGALWGSDPQATDDFYSRVDDLLRRIGIDDKII